MKKIITVIAICITSNVFAQWSNLGPGLNNMPTNAIVYKDKLYVIGYFTAAGGTTITNGMASWDGTKWENVIGLAGFDNTNIFFVQGDYLYVAINNSSSKLQINGVKSNYGIVKFDGTKWTEVAMAQTMLDSTRIPSYSMKYVKPILESNGSRSLNGVHPAISNDKVLFVGKGNNCAPYLATFANGNFSVLFDSSHFTSRPFTSNSNITGCKRYDGYGVVGTQNGYFGSFVFDDNGQSVQSGIYELGLNGTKNKLESSSPSLMANYKNEIYMITNYAGTLNLPTSKIAKWVPNDYMYVPVGVQKDSIKQEGLSFMTVYNNQLWLTGNFKRAGQQLANSLIAWDGSKWLNAEGGVTDNTGLPGTINFAVEYKGELVVGGSFGVAGTKAVNRIARYKAVPNGIEDEASSKSTLLIYPNPAQNEVSLTSLSPISGIFSLFNLQGQQVLEQNIAGTQAKISLVNLPQGIYQYELKNTNGKSEKGKLVVQ